AHVVAVDVSTTSLEHTEKLKQKYDLTNLETRHVAIENAGDLDQQFDLIICTGVLHHLADPDTGLRTLRPNRHLHASGILPETQHRSLATGDQRSDRGLEDAAATSSAAGYAGRLQGIRERRCSGRCAVESARPLVFRPAIARLSRTQRLEV